MPRQTPLTLANFLLQTVKAAPPWDFVNPMSLGLLEGSVTDAETWQDELSSDQHTYGPCIYGAYIIIYQPLNYKWDDNSRNY